MVERKGETGPLLGAHMSIAGGLDKAMVRGKDLTCNTIQIFTKNANQWKECNLGQDKISAFIKKREELNIQPVISHGSYLINLASPDEDIREKSMNAMLHELRRSEKLGIEYLVIHPGSHRGSGEKEGLQRIVNAIDQLLLRTDGYAITMTLETTAGQGTALGYTLKHLAYIMENVKDNSRMALCIDTCHVFAAGYDLRDEKNYEGFFNEVDKFIGMEHLKVIHLNDSKKNCGSRIDRHEELGKGMIGLGPFQRIMQDESLKHIPKILETPGIGTAKNRAKDRNTLQLLRNCVQQ